MLDFHLSDSKWELIKHLFRRSERVARTPSSRQSSHTGRNPLDTKSGREMAQTALPFSATANSLWTVYNVAANGRASTGI